MRAYVRLRAEIILWFHYCVLLSVFSIFQQLLSIGNNYSNGSLYRYTNQSIKELCKIRNYKNIRIEIEQQYHNLPQK